MPSKLEEAFHQEMVGIYRAAAAQCRYRPVRFLQLVAERGGLQAAKELLALPKHPEGLTRLYELRRLDLSMEALVLKRPWSELFTEEELSVARRRLRDLGFPTS